MLINILTHIWHVAEQMSPYLLLGFLIAGLLSILISPETIERHLGKRNFWQVCKAALLGVPLPLCSCGVLPVSASLRRHGAGKGQTLSFLVSTPQTGVDSILATHAMLGPVFVVFRVVTAFVSGILCGSLVELLAKRENVDLPPSDEDCAHCEDRAVRHWFLRATHYGFVTLAREIGRAMLLGIVIAGVLTALVPEDYFMGRLPYAGTILLMMIAGIPMYVCSTGSIPVAFAMMDMGITPGAALVFLVSGPATNAAAISMVWKLIGKQAMFVYLSTIAVCALVAGILLDQVVGPDGGRALVDAHSHAHPDGLSWLGTLSAIALFAILLPSLRPHKQETDH
jgi:uncharacterized membrane protein YraQ (UPF0718 family)